MAWARPPPRLAKDLGELIRAARLAHGDTQKELAEELGVKQSMIANVEGGRYVLNTHRLLVVCDLYSITPNELLAQTAKTLM
jgi:transcriptional regulator with XRE-family HTH domain